VGDGPGTVDPLKDINAAKARVDLGVSTLAKESMLYDGSDWEENHEQRALEVKRRMEDGLSAMPASQPEDQLPQNPDLPERT
jgi:capsid protein